MNDGDSCFAVLLGAAIVLFLIGYGIYNLVHWVTG